MKKKKDKIECWFQYKRETVDVVVINVPVELIEIFF